MGLVARERPATRLEAWSLATGLGISILAVSFIAWAMADVDGDGATSFQEFQEGSQPMHGDSDGDGVADGWEIAHGFSAISAASTPPQADPTTIQACLSPPTQSTTSLLEAPASVATSTPGAECTVIQEAYGDDPESAPQSTPAAPSVSPQRAIGTTIGAAIGALALASIATVLTARRILH